jgi:hypothetical protein
VQRNRFFNKKGCRLGRRAIGTLTAFLFLSQQCLPLGFSSQFEPSQEQGSGYQAVITPEKWEALQPAEQETEENDFSLSELSEMDGASPLSVVEETPAAPVEESKETVEEPQPELSTWEQAIENLKKGYEAFKQQMGSAARFTVQAVQGTLTAENLKALASTGFESGFVGLAGKGYLLFSSYDAESISISEEFRKKLTSGELGKVKFAMHTHGMEKIGSSEQDRKAAAEFSPETEHYVVALSGSGELEALKFDAAGIESRLMTSEEFLEATKVESTPEELAGLQKIAETFDGQIPDSVFLTGPTSNTDWDRITDFGAAPTISAAAACTVTANCNWSSASSWNLGRIPQANDIVAIGSGIKIIYDQVSSANLNTVQVRSGGLLEFRTDINTEMRVSNFMVLQNGELRIGTAAQPVAANVTAKIIFPNIPLNTTLDPGLWGNGLIALGSVIMRAARIRPERILTDWIPSRLW